MAKRRIPRWANRPEQYNHKIVKAFFEVEQEVGYVSLEALERRCSNEEKFPKTFVKSSIAILIK